MPTEVAPTMLSVQLDVIAHRPRQQVWLGAGNLVLRVTNAAQRRSTRRHVPSKYCQA